MKVMVTGVHGFIGSYLFKHFDLSYGHDEAFDVANEGMVAKVVKELDPDVIIHCAAIKDVKKCQESPHEAFETNTIGTLNIANQCENRKLIYLSTDMIFSGTQGLLTLQDVPHPNTVYGYSKMVSEEIVKKLDDYAICRSSAVYGWTKRKLFNMWLYENLQAGKPVEIFHNYYNSPTYVVNLCEMIDKIIREHKVGTFHTCGPDRYSKYNFALELAKTFDLNTNLIKSIPTKDTQDISLATTPEKQGGFKMDDVPTGLKRMKMLHEQRHEN